VAFSRTPRRRGDFPGEDWELAYRLSRRLATVHVPEPTVIYRVHGGSNFTDWDHDPSIGTGASRSPSLSFDPPSFVNSS
jgi:hypothetical protein